MDRHIPDTEARAVYEQLYPIFLATYEALVPIFNQLHALSHPASG